MGLDSASPQERQSLSTITQTTLSPLGFHLGVILLGFVITRLVYRLEDRTVAVLCLFIFMPALYFRQALGQNLASPEFSFVFFFYLFHTVTLYLVSKAVFSMIYFPLPTVPVGLMNVLITSALGLRYIQDYITRTIQAVQITHVILFYHSLIFALAGIYLIAAKKSFRHSVVKILCTPLPYAILLGTLFTLLQIQPYFILDPIDKLYVVCTPLVLLLIGLMAGNQVYFLDPSSYAAFLPGVGLCAGLRLAISPLLAVAIVLMMGIDDMGIRRALIITSGLPTGLFACVLAGYYGKTDEKKFTILSILITTAFSLITLPLLVWMLNRWWPV